MISVIVPVYNAEKYLDRCIQSILTQTYTVFELLLINDGSTDSSGAICDRYAEQDSRVRVFHKENGGVSSARNMGLDNAKGEWIAFVDSDDWVLDSYLYNLVSHSHNVDLVISYAEYLYSNGERKKEEYASRMVSNEIDVLFTENDLSWHTSPWAKLFNKKFCDQLRFIEGMHIGEDLVFLYTYMLKSNKIYVSNDTDYIYFVESQNSLTKRVNQLQNELLSYVNVRDIVDKLIKEKNISHPKAISNLGWTVAYYVRRVLNAIYYDGEDRTLGSRIDSIKSLDINTYVKYIGATSIREKLYRYILKREYFILYDIVRRIVVCLKFL